MENGLKELSNAEFNQLSSFIYENYGIKLPPVKKSLLQARLQARLRACNLSSFKEYCEYVFSDNNHHNEIVHMIDVVSTNKTDFFREPAHFDFMNQVVLPEYIQNAGSSPLKVWSAACSSGEEVYTIAIVINEYANVERKINFSILGTDISTRILDKAVMGVYPEERVMPVPLPLRKKYILRSKDRQNPKVRVVPELRAKAAFQRLNLMDDSYAVPSGFNIIFCRNVLIYFDKETQEAVINKLVRHLLPDGYLFLGHSESITGFNVPLKPIKPAIYKLK